MGIIVKRFLSLLLILISTSSAYAGVPQSWSEDKVFILPEEGRAPWLDAIRHAEKTIHMAAYKISDPQILDALEKKAKSGVQIHLLIEGDTFKHEKSANIASPLEALGKVAKIYALSKRFNQCHHKMIVVDQEWGMISTGNLDHESFDGIPLKKVAAARDFAVPVLNGEVINEMLRVFDADIHDTRLPLVPSALVWGPDHQRSTFLSLFNQANKTIDIYQQSFQDVGLAEAAAGAARAGVKVRVLMMPFPFGAKEDPNIPNQNLMMGSGVHVGLLEKYYVHAKIVIVDQKIMYVGSGNFYTPSLDQTRELGLLIENPEQIKAVQTVFDNDWSSAQIDPKRESNLGGGFLPIQ